MSCVPQTVPPPAPHAPTVLPFTPIPVGKTLTVDQVRQIPELHTSAEVLVAAPGFPAVARYTYDPAVYAPDNGTTVLRPVWRTADEPGRWLREDLGGLAEHLAAADPHPQYETTAEVAAQIANHEAAVDPHSQYQRESEKGVAGGYASLDFGGKVPDGQIPDGITRDTELATAISDHEAEADPHPDYTTDAEAEAIAASEVADHEAAGDPHPQYTTAAEATVIAGDEASDAVNAHEAAGDPHPDYQLESEKDTANGYAGLDADGLILEARMPFPRGRYGWTVDDDFHQATVVVAAPGHSSREGWVRVINGTGSAVAKIAGTVDHPGIIELRMGTAALGRAHLHLDLKAIRLSGGRLKYEAAINIPTTPNGTTDFKVVAGLAGTVGAGDPTNGVGGMIDRSVSTTDWLRFTNKAGVKNKNASGQAFVAGWNKVAFIVNPAGTNVDFEFNGVSGGSENTNIPLAAGEELGFIFTIERLSADTNDRTIEIDYVVGRQWLTNLR